MSRSRKHWPESQRATARRLRREGLTVTQISDRLSVPRSTVGDWTRGIEGQRFCLLCGDPVLGRRYAAFCCEQHGHKFHSVFGSRIYGQRRAA